MRHAIVEEAGSNQGEIWETIISSWRTLLRNITQQQHSTHHDRAAENKIMDMGLCRCIKR